ncbi:MAG: hypothetical protein ACFCAD_08735 [Pleurocapsa sp.]
MPNKRSGRNTKKFFCPYCETRLWRLGTTKYHLFYKDAIEIRKHTGISSKKSKLLANQNSTYLDSNKWIEGFCCPHHGSQWLLLSVKGKNYEYRLAKEKDWLQTEKTLDQRVSNPSVGEFTLKMSRKLR